jgi:hypothetical protein
MKKQKEYTPPVYIGQNLYIKPNYIVSIPEYYKEGGKGMSIEALKNRENLKNNDHAGKLSRKAIRNLKNSINWLCIAAKKKRVFNRKTNSNFYFKVNFVTLTLPDTKEPITSNDLQKKLLNPFLTYMRKYHGLKNYVWRLEFQANGKLHVHLTTDSFLHLTTIREAWNRLLDNNGYLQLFFEKEGHKNPNSTDVHATKKVKNMAAYLAKYMSKKGNKFELKEKVLIELEKEKREKLTPEQFEKFSFILAKRKKQTFSLRSTKAGYYVSKKAQNDWYFQRLAFWNSPFNPRQIKGRIWSCNAELSKAGKTVLHIPASDAADDLKCLMRSDIEYKEIIQKPTGIFATYAPDDWRNQPRKIGEVYFLKAIDWFTKINGEIRKKFEAVRAEISNLNTCYEFELN